MTFEPGSMFAGQFRVERPLSQGGMGAVYIAFHVATGARRALKVMHAQLAADPGFRARFEQEARVGAQVESDHVVQVLDAGVDVATGMPWLAMELLDGEDLGRYVQTRGRLAPIEAREILAQLGHAISAAHRAKIVHRDLKPENVFVAVTRRVDGARTVKVLDFGIAKIMADARRATTMQIGTPAWMAPEQADARGDLGPWTDVWPIGLIAFFVLTGKPFWKSVGIEDAPVSAILREVLVDSIPPASERARELGAEALLPAGLDAWLARCLARAPRARFADAAEAMAALLPLLETPPVAKTAPREVTVPMVAKTVPLGPLTEALEPPASSEGAPLPPPPRARRRLQTRVGLAAAFLVVAGGATAAFVLARGGGGAAGGSVNAGGGAAVASAPSAPVCKALLNLFQTSKEAIDVDAYLVRGTPTLDALAARVEAILKRYAEKSRGKVSVHVRDGTSAPSDTGLAVAGADARDVPQGSTLGLVLSSRGERETVPLEGALNSEELSLEWWIVEKLRQLVAKADNKASQIGVLTGHGEIGVDTPDLAPNRATTLKQLASQAFAYVTLKTVDASKEIDPRLDALLVTQPDKDLTEVELRAIDAFVMRGRGLVVAAGAVNLKAGDVTCAARLSTHGLARLLAGYGIELREDVVIDHGALYAVNAQTQDASVIALRFPQIAIAKSALGTGGPGLASDFPALATAGALALPFASSIVIHPDAQPDAKVRVVARSSDQSERLIEPTLDLRWERKWTAPSIGQTFDLAAVVEGPLRSAFSPAAKSERPSRVFVIASPDVWTNPWVRAGRAPDAPAGMTGMNGPGDERLMQIGGRYAQDHMTAAILSFKNALDWAASEEDWTACGRLAAP